MVSDDPGFVIWEALNGLGWCNIILAEIVICS